MLRKHFTPPPAFLPFLPGLHSTGCALSFALSLSLLLLLPLPSLQIMMTLEYPAVTNTRVNGDGGLAIEGAVLPSLLTGIVGLGWSKDNLRTADRCYVNGTYPNGTVKWPCGSSNQGEGTGTSRAPGLVFDFSPSSPDALPRAAAGLLHASCTWIPVNPA